MIFKSLIQLTFLVLILTGCGGAGNEELEKGTLGLKVTKVAGDNQILEEPSILASQELILKVASAEGSPLTNTQVFFKLLNPESGAQIIRPFVFTDSEGIAKVKVRGGLDFGVEAQILAEVAGTELNTTFLVKVKDKIIPEKVEIIPPASEVKAGENTTIQFRLLNSEGKLATSPEFTPELVINFRTPSDSQLDPDKFTPATANITQRTIKFDKGIAFLKGLRAKVAEDVTISLEDADDDFATLANQTGKPVDLSSILSFTVVPNTPALVRMYDPDASSSYTTDDPVSVKFELFDEYGNQAYNHPTTCEIDLRMTGLSPSQGLVVGTSYSDTRVGTIQINNAVGSGTIRSSKVGVVLLNMQNPRNCGAITPTNPNSYREMQDVIFGAGAPAGFQFTALNPGEDTLTVDEKVTLTVEAVDAGGNRNTTFTGQVTIALSGADAWIEQGGLKDNDQILTISNGSAFFDVKNKNVESITVSIIDHTPYNFTINNSQVLNFQAGAPHQYAFSQDTLNHTADNPVSVTVEIWDRYGNLVTAPYSGNVLINAGGTSSFDSEMSKIVNFSGSNIETVTIVHRAAESYNLSFATSTSTDLLIQDNGTTETGRRRFASSVTTTNGILDRIVIQDPDDATIDDQVPVTVTAFDAYNNRALDFNNTTDIALTLDNGATGGGTIAFSNGTATMNINNLTRGNVHISLTTTPSPFLNSASDVVDTTSTQIVFFEYGEPTTYELQPLTDAKVDVPITAQVKVYDQGGNEVSDHTGQVDLRVNGSAVFDDGDQHDSIPKQVTVTFDGVNALATADIYNKVAEQVRVTLIDSQSTGLDLNPDPAQQTVYFLPGDVTDIIFQTPAPAPTVDAPATVTMLTVDQFGNHNTTDINGADLDINITMTQPAATATPLPDDPGFAANYTFIDGAATFEIENTNDETVTVELDSTPSVYNNTDTQDITFAPGVTAEIRIEPQVEAALTFVNTDIALRLQSYDQYGNETLSNQQYRLRINNGDAYIVGAVTPQSQLYTLNNGVADLLVHNDTAEVNTFEVLNINNYPDISTLTPIDIEFLPGPATQYVIADYNPINDTETSVAIKIQAQDAQGNVARFHQDDVILNIGAGSRAAFYASAQPLETIPSGTEDQFIVDIIDGEATVYLVKRDLTTDSQVDLYLTNISDSLSLSHESGTPASINFIHAPAFKYVFGAIESLSGVSDPITADHPFRVNIQAQDRYSNLASTYTGDITIEVNGDAFVNNAGSDKQSKIAINSGVGSQEFYNRTAEEITISLTQNLNANTDNLNMTTQNLIIDHGILTYVELDIPSPNQFVVGSTYNGRAFITDAYGNVFDDGYTGGDLSLSVDGSAIFSSNSLNTRPLDFTGVAEILFNINNEVTEDVTVKLLDATNAAAVPNLNTNNTFNLVWTPAPVEAIEITSNDCVSVDNVCKVNLRAKDQFNNTVTNFDQLAPINASIHSGSAYFVKDANASSIDVRFNSGLAVIDLGSEVPGTVQLALANNSGFSFTFPNDKAQASAPSTPITFTYGVLDRFEFVRLSENPRVNVATSITVRAADQFGNPVENFTGSVVVNLKDGTLSSVLPTTIDFEEPDKGEASTNIQKDFVGTVTLHFDASSPVTDITDEMTLLFEPGPAHELVITGAPTNISIDDSFTLRAELKDASGNLCTQIGSDVDIDIILDGATGPSGTGLNMPFTNGTIVTTIRNTTVESTTLRFANLSVSPLGVALPTANIDWTAGQAVEIRAIVTGGAPASFPVSDTPSITLQAYDRFGNTTSFITGLVDVDINKNAQIVSSGKTLSNIDISSGSSSFNIQSNKAETGISIIPKPNGSTDPNVVTFTPLVLDFVNGAADRYVIKANDGTVDDPITLTIELQDSQGNIVADAPDHNIVLSHDSATATLTNTNPLVVDGVATVDLSNTNDEIVTVTIDSETYAPNNPTLASKAIKFDPGFVTQIVVSSPGTAPSGTDVQVSFEAQDQYGNRNNIDGVTYVVEWTAKTSSGTTRLDPAIQTVSIINGLGTTTANGSHGDPQFTDAVPIIFSMTGITPTTNQDTPAQTINITSSTATTTIEADTGTRIVLDPPTNVKVPNDMILNFKVTDPSGNVDTSAADQSICYTLTSTSSSATLTDNSNVDQSGSFTITSGQTSFKLKNVNAEDVTLSFSTGDAGCSTSLTLPNTRVVTFLPGTPDRYEIVSPPTTTTASATFNNTIQVRALDSNGNLVYNAGTSTTPGRVRLNTSIAAGSVFMDQNERTPIGTNTIDLEIVNGIADVLLRTEKAGVMTLQLQGMTDPIGAPIDTTTHTVTVNPGAVSSLRVVDPYDSVVGPNKVDVYVQAYDDFNNPSSAISGTIDVSVDGLAQISNENDATPQRKTINLVNGGGSMQIESLKAQTVNISLSNPGGGADGLARYVYGDIIFLPAAIANLAFTSYPVNAQTGQTYTVEIKTMDQYGNHHNLSGTSYGTIDLSLAGSAQFIDTANNILNNRTVASPGLYQFDITNSTVESTLLSISNSSAGFSLPGDVSINWIGTPVSANVAEFSISLDAGFPSYNVGTRETGQSVPLLVTNTSDFTSNNLTITLLNGNSSIWSLNNISCVGVPLNASATCKFYLNFIPSNATELSSATYRVSDGVSFEDVTVSGAPGPRLSFDVTPVAGPPAITWDSTNSILEWEAGSEGAMTFTVNSETKALAKNIQVSLSGSACANFSINTNDQCSGTNVDQVLSCTIDINFNAPFNTTLYNDCQADFTIDNSSNTYSVELIGTGDDTNS